MSDIDILIIFMFIPFMIGGMAFAIVQRKFFDRYTEVFHPTEPVSTVDLMKLRKEDSDGAKNYFKDNPNNVMVLRPDLFFKQYKDERLQRYLFQLRVIFCIEILLPILGVLVVIVN